MSDKTSGSDLHRLEKVSSASQFLPKKDFSLITENTYFQELFENPPSKYRLPLPLLDTARLQIRQILGSGLFSRGNRLYENDSSLSPYWRIVLEYLLFEGITSSRHLIFEHIQNDDPKLFALRLRAKRVSGMTDGSPNALNGWYCRGVSYDFNEAVSKVIGELLERYPLTIYRQDRLLDESLAEMRTSGHHFLDPKLIDRFSDRQKESFPQFQITDDKKFRWVKGISLTKKTAAFIPAQLVYWNYRFVPGEPVLGQPITNGAGGFFMPEGAMLSGLYELIQRDTFLLFWLNQKTPESIDLDSLSDPRLRAALSDIESYHLELRLLCLKNEFGVPVFVSVLLDSGGLGPAVAVGGGCGSDTTRAILRSITEALGVRIWLRNNTGDQYPRLPDSYQPFREHLGQSARLAYWGHPAMREHLEFFLRGTKVALNQTSESRLSEKLELDRLLRLFAARGPLYEVFAYEAKHPVLDTLRYHSVHIVVPALIPLYLDEFYAPLGAQRLKEDRLRSGSYSDDDPNPLPHPFP